MKEYVYGAEYFNAPGVHDVHVDAIMSNVSVAYRNTKYIATEVFPAVRVNKQSDKYFIFTKGHWFRDEARMRAPGTRAARVDFTLETDQYATKEYAAATGLPDEVRDNADNPLRPEIEKVEFVTEKLLIRKEKEVSDIVFGSGWSSSSAAASLNGAWDGDTSKPIEDVLNTIRPAIRQLVGSYPNVCVLGAHVWEHLQTHPDLLELIKYTTGAKTATPEMVANLFQVEKLLIGTAIINSSQEGATDSFSDIWGSTAWFGYVAPNPGLMTMSAGYVFQWKDRQTNRYIEDQEHQTVFEVLENWTTKAVCADCGYKLTSVVS